MNAKDREESLTLELLRAVGERHDVTQRHLARRLGVALGLANAYLKRCVRKGWIKVRQAPPNRYLYYLTPEGFAEKSRLTGRYLANSFAFYRQASDSCARVFSECRHNGWKKIVLGGVSDLAEIATIRALDHGIQILGTYDPESRRSRFLGWPVWTSWNKVPEHDVCLVTDLAAPEAAREKLIVLAGKERVLVPDILGLD